MPKAWSPIKLNQRGFSPVEILLAAALFGFFTVAFIGAFIYGRAATQDGGDRAAALLLADEGIQAVRNIRNGAFSNLVNGTHGLAQTGGVWALSGSSDTSGIYTRQVTIADDSDSNRKAVTSTVSWSQGGDTQQVSVFSILANWMAVIKSWANGILAGSADSSGTVNATKVATAGNYAYSVKATTSSNFVVTDISNPAAPAIVRTISITGTPSNIAISGNYAYVTTNNGSGELVVVNITTPTTATVAATYNAPGTAAGLSIATAGNYAYVGRALSSTDAEFLVVNVANPLSPALSGSLNGSAAMNKIYVSGDYAYVAISSLSTPMLVVNIATPASPTQSLAYSRTVSANALTIGGHGSYVYLGAGSTLYILNVTTPTAPSLTRQVTAAGTINDIDEDGAAGNIFMGTSSTTGEFQVVNASAPASASVIRTVDVPGTASTVSGVSYNTSLDRVAAASAADTQEVLVFTKN